MKVSILIVSFSRDQEFLRYSLRSIRKFATGFHEVVVVVPRHDEKAFDWVPSFDARLEVFDEEEGKGMLHHELMKIMGDVWCPEADAIAHMDSDCMFWEDAKVDDYVIGGRPVMYRERFDSVVNKLRLNWKAAVKAATGIDPEWDGMTRHPCVFLPETYKLTRQLIEAHTGRSTKDYILSCRNAFPQTFAEFPTLAAVALQHHPEKYHWVDHHTEAADGGYVYVAGRDRMVAMWTHAGVTRYKKECDAILAGERSAAFSAHEVK